VGWKTKWLDGEIVVAYWLMGEGVVWQIGAVVCLLVAPRLQLFAGAGLSGSRPPNDF